MIGTAVYLRLAPHGFTLMERFVNFIPAGDICEEKESGKKERERERERGGGERAPRSKERKIFNVPSAGSRPYRLLRKLRNELQRSVPLRLNF